MRRGWLVVVLAGCGAPPAITDRSRGLQAEVAGSWVSEGPGEISFARAGAAGLRYREGFGRFGLGPALGVSVWRAPELDGDDDAFAAGVLGLEASVLSAGGRVRSDVSGGFATLLEGTEQDDAWTLGFFVDIRPVTYRFGVGEAWVLAFTPLTLAVLVPEPGGIPLLDVQYRWNLALEWLP